MHIFFRLALFAAVFALLALESCWRGPPDVPASAHLSPGLASGLAQAKAPLAVAFAGPRGEVTEREHPAITVLFNRSMRAIESPDDANLPELRVEAKDGRTVPGFTRWVGTHGLLFAPSSALPGASEFAVTVAAGVRSVDGDALSLPYRFEFKTPAPSLVESEPPAGARDLRPATSFRLRFNEAVEPAAVERAAKLVVQGREVALHAIRPAQPSPKTQIDHLVTLVPSVPLPLDSAVSLTLSAALQSAEGPRPMGLAKTIASRTYGPLRLEDFRCPRVSLGRCQAHRDVTLVLSNAVTIAELRAHLKTELPRAAPSALLARDARAAGPKPSEPARVLALGVDPQPGHRYRVTLSAGMRDVFGQALARDVEFEVEIEAPYAKGAPRRAERALEDGDAREPEAPADDSVARREVLRYEAKLGIEGDLLEAVQGGPIHRLPVGVVNVPTYGLSTSALRDAETLRWLAHRDRSLGPVGAGWHWDWVSPSVPDNTRSVRAIDLDALLRATPGARAALVGLAVPGQAEEPETALVNVTDLGVTARLSRYGTLVWVTRLSNGEPIAGAGVAIRTATRELFSTTTDARGTASIPADAADLVEARDSGGTPDRRPWLFVRNGEDWTVSGLGRSTADARAAPDVDVRQRADFEALVFTDRGVYRPGETLRLSAIVRKGDAAGLRVPPATDVRVEVKDAEDERIFAGHATTDSFGELALDVPLPRTSHLGTAVVTARAGARGDGEAFATSVLLAAYKAAEFQVDVSARRHDYVRGEVAEFAAKAAYLYGAPMGGASAHIVASRTVTSYAPPGADAFTTTDDVYTTDYADTSPRSSQLDVDDGALDAEGRLSRSIPLDMPGQRGPEVVSFETQIEDVTRETVASSASILVHPAPYYVGLGRPAQRFVAVGAHLKPDVVAFEPGGEHRPGVRVRLELVSRVWADVAIDEAGSVPHHVTRPVDKVVASCDVTTTASVASCPLRVNASGYYIVRATSSGPVVRASTYFYALDDQPDHPPSLGWSDGNARGLRLEADKDTYAVGETAKILIGSPFQEADALVTLERGGVLWHDVVHVKGSLPVISVPIAHEDYPNVFVGVHLVRGRVSTAPAAGLADLGAPDFRVGYRELAIDPSTHRLAVEVRPSRSEIRPGDPVDADVRVTGVGGKGVRAAVTFYAVDEGVLMLTAYKTPDPLPSFAEHKRLADIGVDTRERLAHFVAMRDGERVPILGYEVEPPPPESEAAAKMADKGENGGGGDSPMRGDFRSTIAFEAGRVTDEEGAARFSFRAPDNLTRFRLMAVVASPDDRFGFGEASITSSRPLMARPALPRIVRVGDAFDASVAVSVKDADVQRATVTLDAAGIATVGPRSQTVTIGPGRQAEARFAVQATTPGRARFAFDVRSGPLVDRVSVERQVDLPVDLRSSTVYGEMTGDTAISLGDLRAVRPDQGALRVRLSTTALVGVDETFDELERYPYGCTEQLASRTLPLLALDGMARAFHVRVAATNRDSLDDAVAAILSHQHGSGGFGYWDDDPEVPWLSAFATWALKAAADKGYYVPADTMERAVGYLRAQLNAESEKARPERTSRTPAAEDETPSDTSDEEEAPEPAGATTDDGFTRPFIADVLAEIGSPDPGALDRAFESRDALTLSGQALLLHAMARAHIRGNEPAVLARAIEQRLRVTGNQAVADDAGNTAVLDSTARATALVLRALLAFDPKHPLASRLARGLLGMRSGSGWRSTQENAWALVALDDYRQAQESAPVAADVEAFVGAELVTRAAFRTAGDVAEVDLPMDRVARSGAQALAFRVKSDGRVYYSAELDYASTELASRPDDSGFFVQRLVRPVKPRELLAALRELPRRSTARAEAGDIVIVDLLVESAEPRDQVVLVDPLPSGLQAIDYNLETTSRVEAVEDVVVGPVGPGGGSRPGYGGAFAQPERVHREIHDDRVLTFVGHMDPGLYHFRYAARAATPGRFVTPPAEIRCMYSPEASGRTAASTFEIVSGSAREARLAQASP